MPAPKGLNYKRRNYFIDKEFQSKFILKFCLLIAGGGLLTMGILYLLARRSTTVSILDSRVVVLSTADFILPLLIQTVAVVTILVGLASILVTLFVSHKIVGPLYRFKKGLEKMRSGDLFSDFHIRSYDQLQDLAGEFNSMIDKVREQIKLVKANLADLKAKKGNISDQDIEELDKNINYFKT